MIKESLKLEVNTQSGKLAQKQNVRLNTLATGYGDFRTSVAKRRRRATEISVFPYGWMEEEFGFVMC